MRGQRLALVRQRKDDVIGPSGQRRAHPEPEAPDAGRHGSVREWLRARVARDAPMQEAARSRDAAPRPAEANGHDVASVVTRDHDAVTALFRRLAAIPGVAKGATEAQRSRRAAIARTIVAALADHERTEEEHLWPAVRRSIEGGEELRRTGLAQEQSGGALAAALAELSPSELRFDQLVEELEATIRVHVAFEDRVLLRLCEAMGVDEQDEVGKRFQDAKRGTPRGARAGDDAESRE